MRVSLFLACALLAAAGAPTARAAQPPPGYPSRPLEIIVPFAAGGGMDTATRLLARYAEPGIGQNIAVVNRTQGGNIQGNIEGIRAAPDGHVLLSWGIGLVTDELIVKNAPYRHTDITPVCMFANDPGIIVVGAGFAKERGIADLAGLVEYVAANPGRVTIGMGGNWTSHDFLRLKFEAAAGVKFNRMPFLGGAPAIRATAEGNCNVTTSFLSELLPWMDTGKVIPLAVAGEKRLEALPDVPTMAEAGYTGVVQSIWRVVSAPARTPPAIVSHLEAAFADAAKNPEYLREASLLGVNPVFKPSGETARFIQEEYERYAELTDRWGIRLDGR